MHAIGIFIFNSKIITNNYNFDFFKVYFVNLKFFVKLTPNKILEKNFYAKFKRGHLLIFI